MVKDNLGIFGHADDNTGEYNVEELRAALSSNPRGTDQQTIPRASPTRERRARRLADAERRRRRFRSSIVALVVLLVIAGGTFALVRIWSNQEPPPAADFGGAGTTETVIRISPNDGLTEIGTSLFNAKVVASVEAFVQTATGNADITAIQPGYYKVHEGASAAQAISALLTATNQVGKVDLIPGVTLGDTTVVSTGKVIPGYVSQLTAAACVPLNGASNCFTTADLEAEMRTADVGALGLVDWAVARVNAVTDLDRRLEGMIAPGVYNIPPTNDPAVVLKSVLSTSAVYWNTSEIATKAQTQGHDPYDMAIIASLIEREAITSDMPNVSRVIENRLAIPMILQLDSTVNYAKAESQIATNETDRNDPTSPYNTYAHEGLPPTPIGGIGPNALDAALHPANGPWLYFVKIDPVTGKSCFSTTLEEHDRCVAQAQANGVFG